MSIIVVSDIHLFSKVCLAKSFIAFLNEIKDTTKKIIILGDLFDGDNFNAPTKDNKKNHIKVLGKIRQLVDSGIEVVWVEGNHDREVIGLFSGLIGAKEVDAKTYYELTINNKKWIFMHGHQFDTFISKRPVLTALANYLYTTIQYFDGHKFTMSRWLKKRSKTFLKICKVNKDRAIKFAANEKADFIVTGHVHKVGRITEKRVTYINTGCWVDSPSHFLEIKNDGTFRVNEFVYHKEDQTCRTSFTELPERALAIR